VFAEDPVVQAVFESLSGGRPEHPLKGTSRPAAASCIELEGRGSFRGFAAYVRQKAAAAIHMHIGMRFEATLGQ
jgi:hypothetical protein